MEPKCTCGGMLESEEIPKSPENEEHIIGRCVVCKKPHYFSKAMWENLSDNNS